MLDQNYAASNTIGFTQSVNAPLMRLDHVNLWYGHIHALIDLSLDIYPREIIAFIGPSGCGKSTALKCLNRMHDETRGVRITGRIEMEDHDIYAHDIDPPVHRRRFGWVAQKPNPFASSIWENVAYGARLHGLVNTKGELADHIEDCLRKAHLWDEVKDRLHTLNAYELSGGQQQRLCVARALSTMPDVLLMDEPTGSIDPIATTKIEELIIELGKDHAVVIITHSMAEARRIADRVAYFHLGRLLEVGPTEQVFTNATHKETRAFISGAMG